jgi:GAF domain-containing protein/CheY-like chemotaxis protein
MSDHDYTLKVLIVDDDKDVRVPLAEWLEVVEGMMTDTAKNEGQALELVKQDDGQYDVVLLDKDLAGEDGIDVMRQIHAEFPDLSVIMFTGQDHAAGAEAKREGAYDHLLKPFDDEHLVDLIREAAGQSVSARDAFLYQTAEGLCQSLGVPICTVWLLDRIKGQFKIEAWAGDVSRDYRSGTRIDWEKAAPRRFPGRGRTVYFSDLRKERAAGSLQHWEAMIEQGWTSLLSTPMVMEGRTIGIIDVYTLEERIFTDEERERLGDEAAKAAISVRNAQLAERSRALLDITQVITSSVGIKEGELFELILKRGLEFVGTEIGWLYLVDRATNSLRIESSRGIEEEEAGTTRQVGEGITGWVAEHGIPQNVPDVGKDDRYFHARGPKVRSEIVVPLKYGEDVIGVLTAKSPFLDAFSADDMYLLSTFASQAAIALENIRQHRELSVLYDTSRDIAGEQDLEEMLEKTVSHATKLLDAKGGGVYLPLPGKEELKLSVTHGLRDTLQGVTLAFGEGMAGKVFLDGKPMKAPDLVEGRPDYSEWSERAAVFDADEFTAVVEVPLIAGEKTLGVLFVADDIKRRAFTKKDERLLERLANQAAIALRNASRIDELEVLNEIGREVSAELDYRKLLDLILQKAKTIVPFEYGNISLIDRPSNRLVVESTNIDGVERLKTKVGEGVTGWVAKYGESLRVNDVKSSIEIPGAPEQPTYLEFTEETQSELCVPLCVQDEILGVINVESPKSAAFDEEDQSQLETLASQAAVAIYKSRLVQKLDEARKGQIEAIKEIGASISTLLDLEVVLKGILESTGALLGQAHLGEIRELNPETNELEVVVVHTEHEGRINEEFSSIRMGKGLVGWVAEERQSLIVSDVSEDPRYLPYLDITGSEMDVPILVGDELYGVFSIEHPETHAFSEDDRKLLEAMASLAAVAIENNRTYEQRVKDIAALQKINEAVVDADLDGIPQLIADEIVTVMPGEYCSLWLYEPESEDLILRAAHRPLGEAVEEINRLKAGEQSLCRQVAEIGESSICADVSSEEGFYRIYQEAKSSMTAPLKYGGEILGALNVESSRKDAFSERHIELLKGFAGQASLAIENAKLYQELEQSNEKLESRVMELEILIEIGRTVSSMGIEEILEMIYREAGKLMDVRNIQIAFYDEETDMVSFPFACVDGEQVEVGVGMFSPRKRGRDRYGLTEYVIDQGAAVSEGDIWEWAAERGIELSSSLDTQSWIGAPLKVGERVIGLISIQSLEQEDAYDENHLRVLETIASQAAVAIENARLYENLEDKIEQLKSAQERIAETESVITRMSIAADFVHRVNNLAGTIPFWVDEARARLSKDPVNRESLAHALDRIDLDVDGLLRAAEQLNSPLEPKKVNVAEKLNSLARQALVQAPANIKVEVDCASEDLFVKAVDKEMAYAFWSIIENSIAAMPEGGVLTVRARKAIDIVAAEERVRVQIEDEGLGIAESEKERIFEPFYSTRERHLGYGLWRAKNIFEKIGGNIVFESEEGVGTKFVIDLPMATEGEKNA